MSEQGTLIAISAVVGIACWGGLALASLSSQRPWMALPLALIAAVWGWNSIRAALAGVWFEGQDVVIRRPVKTLRLPVHDVQDFYMRAQHCRLRRMDGSEVRVFGISAPNRAIRPDNRAADDCVIALNEELVRRRQQPSATAA